MNTFECDKDKARSNYEKHGLRFTEGCRIFSGHTLTLPSKQNVDSGELRYVSIGALNKDTAALVAWTHRAGNIRVISVRTASRKEREQYYAHIEKPIN